ncbi:14 kDa phosphohistidine phosphatase-like [Brachionus plicatilis]|uniref:14 kDa phosphohistidine phosphatase-like n=1 Tax=Brachionus plicatilis TaxID=10195 RepID=A0A3M7T0D5_BRAPC|nr:14 kDa phosphohistidine phosphatase-like [Brachionus plicatilis]
MQKIAQNLIKTIKIQFKQSHYLSSSNNDWTDNMSKKSFWQKFYSKHSTDTFEWLIQFDDSLSSLIENATDSVNKSLILDVGCGTSQFSHKLKSSMPSANFLICSDFSHQALELLRSKSNSQTIDFVQCDCKKLPYRHGLFDLIIDKGFTDSLLKETNTKKSIQQTIDSIDNHLDKLDNLGFLIQITDEDPELRISGILDHFAELVKPIMDNIANVDIDESGRFKYILIKVKSSENEKYVVRGYAWAEFHADILDEFEKANRDRRVAIECVGGGRILHEPEKKSILVYGYSLGFGLADHKISVELLKEKFADYNSITFSNDEWVLKTI